MDLLWILLPPDVVSFLEPSANSCNWLQNLAGEVVLEEDGI